MAQVYFDRVQETGSAGLADFTLGGAVSGYQAFGTVCNNGDEVSYCAILATQWEVGLGTYNAGTLERTTVQDSSTGGAKVNFAGVPAVFLTWSGVDAAAAGGGGGTGDVVGPASSVDSRVALFDGITGKLLKESSSVLGSAAFVATTAFDAAGAAASAQAASQPLDGDLTALAALAGTNTIYYRSGVNTWTAVTIGANLTFVAGTLDSVSGGTGDVVGPASAVDNRVVFFDGVTGKLIKDSGLLLSGSNTGDQTNISGNAATVTTNANLTGPVTSSGNATTITDAVVTLAKMADLAQDQFIGRTTASTGVPQTATITAAARTVLDDVSTAAMLTTLGAQPVDSDLTTIAGLTATTDNFIQSKSSAWASRTVAQVSTDLQATGLVTDAVGFRTIPQNSQSAAYTTVAADSGKHIYHPSADTTARTFTIDSNANVAYPIGTAITFINDASAGVATIAITSDTLVLAGAGTTGSRTLAANGIATAVKMTSTRWIINGTGLT